MSAQPRKIVFQHPSYPPFTQSLFTFAACDENDTIDHEITRAACALTADNRYDGYLTTDVAGQERVTVPHLPFIEDGYFFHVPGYDSMTNAPAPAHSTLTIQRKHAVPDISLPTVTGARLSSRIFPIYGGKLELRMIQSRPITTLPACRLGSATEMRRAESATKPSRLK